MENLNPILTEADFQSEVFDLLAYVTGIEEDRIFRGYQSREVLPADDTFLIYTPILRKRIGSNLVTFDADDCDDDENGSWQDSALVQIDVQVDCYGEEAQAKAQGLEIFAHSSLCRNWLVKQGFGIRVLQCTEPVDATQVGETDQYLPRWMVTLSICFKSTLEQKEPWYEGFNFKGIKNIDVYFNP